MKKIITICAFAACLTGCDDLFEPAIENNLGLEYMYENSQYAEGILANAYTRIPCAGYSFNDVATDDAVGQIMRLEVRHLLETRPNLGSSGFIPDRILRKCLSWPTNGF